jgi:hypothetical protein
MNAIPMGALGAWWCVDYSRVLGCVLITLAWGFLFTSIMLSARAAALWPINLEVTDWEKVETLIREHEDKSA